MFQARLELVILHMFAPSSKHHDISSAFKCIQNKLSKLSTDPFIRGVVLALFVVWLLPLLRRSRLRSGRMWNVKIVKH